MKLIVGLGNPGKKYEKTRHNVGFMFLDMLHDKLVSAGINKWELSKKFNALIAGCTYHNEKIILAKPMTYMNRSGEAVGLIAHYYKLTSEDIIIVHDDKDIPFGEIKIQQDRGPAGHNGISSIIDHIATKNFHRIRIGIAHENIKKMSDISHFVLGKFGIFEKKKLQQTIDTSTDKLLNTL